MDAAWQLSKTPDTSLRNCAVGAPVSVQIAACSINQVARSASEMLMPRQDCMRWLKADSSSEWGMGKRRLRNAFLADNGAESNAALPVRPGPSGRGAWVSTVPLYVLWPVCRGKRSPISTLRAEASFATVTRLGFRIPLSQPLMYVRSRPARPASSSWEKARARLSCLSLAPNSFFGSRCLGGPIDPFITSMSTISPRTISHVRSAKTLMTGRRNPALWGPMGARWD